MSELDRGLIEYIRKLPKAELHLHLEGSITPGRLRSLSRKYGSDFARLREEEISEKVFHYQDFHHFLEVYKTVCEHLRSPEDYLVLLEDLVNHLRDQNVRHAEIIFTPTIPARAGLDAEDILTALLNRAAELGQKDGPRILWILDAVRQWGREPAEQTAQWAEQYRSLGVVAIGLGGDEESLPAAEFEEVFSWARAHALFAHVHAGEMGEPARIWEALEVLRANRIGHGIQAARDPQLMEYLRDRTVGLDVCITSNAATGAWRPASENPFWLLHKRGVPVTLNTDDPGMFKTSLTAEYLQAARFFDLDRTQLSYLAIQGVRSSFLPYPEKTEMMQGFQNEIAGLPE